MLKPHEFEAASVNELIDWLLCIDSNPMAVVQELFPDQRCELWHVANDLKRYSGLLAVAKHQRLAGNVESALYYERRCDKIYDGLPDYAKW